MPASRPGYESEFARYQRQLSSWLHTHVCDVRALTFEDVEKYAWKKVVAGWQIRLPDSDTQLFVLLNDSFPFSRIQIAYHGDSRYLQWPHIEEHNFLCLPDEGWRPCENLEHSISQRLSQATDLITNCQSEEFIKSESEREFLTYWGRQDKKLSAVSIIDPRNTKARKISAKLYNGHYLVGESDEQIEDWLVNSGVEESGPSIQAVFAFIDEPPAIPLPRTTRQFVCELLNQAPALNGFLGTLSPFESTLVILASKSDNGVALFGTKMHAAPKRGFRSIRKAAQLKQIWGSVSGYSPVRVNRADSGWIHGLDQDNEGHATLSASHALLLGAGSLGSQIASRLAQAGLGRISIVDPEALDPANVGRHALGMTSINANKAKSLALLLSERYPHGRFTGYPTGWQDVLRNYPEIFEEADIVVSCMGEADQDLALDSRHQSGAFADTPIVYGWLGTQGTTGHALALKAGVSALSCFFDLDGFLKCPDTDFRGDDRRRAEPACGTEFQPYGPLAAGQVELLVTRATIDILTGKVSAPHHKVYACSSEDLHELGGEWTDYHKGHRPDGYEGPFEYTSVVDPCGECHNCQ